MSTSFHMICTKCNESHWCGQRSGSNAPWLYGGDKLPVLAAFLNKHRGHPLVFDSEFCAAMEPGQDGKHINGGPFNPPTEFEP